MKIIHGILTEEREREREREKPLVAPIFVTKEKLRASSASITSNSALFNATFV